MLVWVVLGASLACAGLILVRYYAIQRLIAGIGWALIVLTIGGFGSGLAESFPWAGFVFLFVGSAGLLVIIQDTVVRRQTRRKRQQTQPSQPE